jgi:hypothetical protein
MIRVIRLVWTGTIVAALGLAPFGCEGKSEKPPSVPKAQQEDAVKRMKEGTGGKGPAVQDEKPGAEKNEKSGEKPAKPDKKGGD